MALRVELQNRGDLEGSLAAMEKAISMVAPEGHRDFAWIWCERAKLLSQIGRFDEANDNWIICGAWGSGE